MKNSSGSGLYCEWGSRDDCLCDGYATRISGLCAGCDEAVAEGNWLPDLRSEFRTYPALLDAIKAYARNLRDTSNSKRSAQHFLGNAMLSWANAYDVAGPRPIQRDYSSKTWPVHGWRASSPPSESR